MTDERPQPKIKFVNLHGHSCASVFDGLGYPQEHMEFAYENGLDAIALTDHGTMNNFPYQVFHAQKMKEEGKSFKPIYGVEAYAFPDLDEWNLAYVTSKEKKDDEVSAVVIEDEERNTESILRRKRHMVLLAKNQEGLNSLFKMISKSFERPYFYRKPRMDYNLLKEHVKGNIVATSACLGGVYAGNMWENYDFEKTKAENDAKVLDAMRKTTEQMLDIFGEDWYGEVQWNNIPEQHLLNSYVIQVCDEYNVKLVSTCDAHYPRPELWESREMYKRLGWSEDSPIPDSIDDMDYQLWPKNGDQMFEAYQKCLEVEKVKEALEQWDILYDDDLVIQSIEESYDIAHNKIESFDPDTSVKLPDFVVPEGKTADEALHKLAHDLLHDKALDLFPRYYDRLEQELEVISNRGFSRYFLTMYEIAKEARSLYLSGPGRGSAAGSLLAYVLDITQVDPIEWGTLFERFLTKDGKGYPDIDFDVSQKAEFHDHLIDKWGKYTVVPISNWNTLKLKSLIKDLARWYEIPFKEVNSVTSVMMREATGKAKAKHGIKSGIYTPTFEEVKEFSESLQKFLQKYPHVAKHVDALYGQYRSCSRHAGGCIIADNLNEHIPLINSKGTVQSPWTEGQNVRHLEPLGFIKFDLLGLDTLKITEGCIKNILQRYPKYRTKTGKIEFPEILRFYNEKLHPKEIDFKDQKVYENVFHDGKWVGVFQFTEAGAQGFCQQVKPTSLIDISTVTAIQRPGPLGAGVDTAFIAAREDPKSVEYLNDIHREVTEHTYGFLIYQEQIALLAHKLGKDISLDEGNMLRKVLTKKGTGKAEKVKNALYDKFIEGAQEKGLTKRQAVDMWAQFEYFSGYGFNMSHSISYSIISFQCAWLLTYFPECWIAAYLNEESDTKMEKAISAVKNLGFHIRRPSINSSSDVWEISKDGTTFYQPLTDIEGVGAAAFAELEPSRPFEKIEDIIFNADVRNAKVNKSVLDRLIRSGAMDEIIDDRFTGDKHFWTCVLERPKKQVDLDELIKNEVYREEGSFTNAERVAYISDLTSVFPIDMVLTDEIKHDLEQLGFPPLGEYDKYLNYHWGIPREVRNRTTRKSGRKYWDVYITDSTFQLTRIRCWNIKGCEKPDLNRPYIIANLEYDETWGFSTPWKYPIDKCFSVIG